MRAVSAGGVGSHVPEMNRNDLCRRVLDVTVGVQPLRGRTFHWINCFIDLKTCNMSQGLKPVPEKLKGSFLTLIQVVLVYCHSHNNQLCQLLQGTQQCTRWVMVLMSRNILVSTDTVVLKTPDIFVGHRTCPLWMHRDLDCRVVGVWDLHSCCFCAGELGYSSEAFLSLQMTSP